ncbi:glycosyltransferase family 39 protein [Luteibacter sp. 22Crub2.1]|uniref:ArnT family glycosyltransferase n=1 Tax=Luteibacter sp. 22Crub2.1 TaxID=1283288 RepID=UPI0009C47C26|nr:glycosyltransferase family 39 protein [Luteibacter sp. 22Crub2.1]SKB49062.1 4-amino-4-deoxy-L-arabinose transferase and related glycosyltransferases of PMT family [Luteibacter sp. 22Crub2.1]
MRELPVLAMSMRDRSSVAARARSWRGTFLVLFALALLGKLFIACTLSPFGDEAFYWQESLAPAWGYSDLPPLTAWLIAVSEACFGHGLLSMRLPFLLIGACIPWQVGAIAGRYGGEIARWQAATFALSLPLVGSLGVLALPDVPLTFAIVLASQGLIAALEKNLYRDWTLLGVALAIAWMTHYRAAMPMLGGLVFLVATARGRAQWRRPGIWLALALTSIGLVPIVLYNMASRGAGVAFQLVDRNPWQFHADALVQPLEQAVACTPVAWVVMLWALWRSWRRRAEAPFDVVAAIAGTFVLAYFVLGLFADDVRFRAHWPLPAYTLLCAALPLLLEDAASGWRRAARGGFALAALGLVIGLAYLGLAASPSGARMLSGAKAFPANFTGWRESSAAVARVLRADPSLVVVADNFMLAAELRFALGGGREIYALDSPLNTKHGRARQLADWGLDERGLSLHEGSRLLLVVDETALRERERRDWLGSVCSRVALGESVTRLDLFDKRRRFALYRAGPAPPTSEPGVADPDACRVWTAAARAGG